MPTAPTTSRPWSPTRVVRIVLALGAVGLFVRLAVRGGPGVVEALHVMATRQPGVAIAVLVLVAARIGGLTQVQRASARCLGARLSIGDALRISTASFTLSRVVPGGGAAGGVFAIREFARLGHRPGVAGGTALVSWAVTAVSLAIVVGGGGVAALAQGQLAPSAVVGGVTFLGLLGLAGMVVLVAVRSPAVRRWLVARLAPAGGVKSDRPGWFVGAVRRARASMASAIDDLDTTRGGSPWVRPLLWAAGLFVIEVALLWTAFAAAGVPVSLGMVGAGFLVAATLNTVPEVTPGWIGVYEAAMAATWVTLGVDADSALAAVLLHRLAAFWLPVAIGIIPAVRSLAAGRRATTRADGRADHPAGSALGIPDRAIASATGAGR